MNVDLSIGRAESEVHDSFDYSFMTDFFSTPLWVWLIDACFVIVDDFRRKKRGSGGFLNFLWISCGSGNSVFTSAPAYCSIIAMPY